MGAGAVQVTTMRRTFATAATLSTAVLGISIGVLARSEPCCSIRSIDTRTRTVTVTEKTTGCTYEFQAKTAQDLLGLSAGGNISLDVKRLMVPAEPVGGVKGVAAKPAEPAGKPAEPAGKRAEPAGKSAKPDAKQMAAGASAACGSNVGRN